MARKVFPSNPSVNDIFTSTRGKKFQWNGKVWKRTQDTNVESMTLDNSVDEKLVLRGSDNPTMRFVEGSTDKGNLHWKASTGEMRLVNEEYSQELRLGQNGVTVTGNLDVTGNLEVTGTTTFNGGTLTLGDAASDNVVFGADVNSNIIPNTDDAYDLGSSSQQWKDLYIDGTANIDSLSADTADINAGTIDNTTIGGSTPAAGTFTTLVANGNVDLGDATSDTITATGRFDSDLVPSSDGANALGTTALRWSALFADAATITNDVSVGGNLSVIGDMDVTGTLTYEDVTNIDSVGVVTARSGLVVSSGGANITGGITGDLTGDVTGNADTATTLATSRTLSISSDATGSASFNGGANADIAVTLANSGVTAGTYGSSSAIPAITVDAKGRITSATTSAIDSTSVSNGGESVSVSSGGQITSSANHDFDAGIDVTGNITVTGTVDGRDVASDGSKLDGIESGATADQSASEILTAIKTVDGSSSGLDADLLDGSHGSDYLDYNNFTNTPTIPTNNNQLTNGAGYITSFDITTQTDSKYLRSNTADTASSDITFSGGAGAVTIAANSDIRFTTGSWTGEVGSNTGKIQYHSNHMYFQVHDKWHFRDDSGNNRVSIDQSGNISANGNVTANSDIKLKKNISTIDNALDKVNLLRGVEFDYIENGNHNIGVIAQEVEAVLPDLVHTNEETDTKSVAYSNLTAVLIEAVKELTAEVNTLKAELNTLKGE